MKHWNNDEITYLQDRWGEVSIPAIAKYLGRSVEAVKIKAIKLGLGRHIHSGEYITLNKFMEAIGRRSVGTYTAISWVKNRKLPVKTKKSINMSFRIIYLKDFWKWAKENRTFINFVKFEENSLGEEPDWVKDQRRADIAFAKYKKSPWTKDEDSILKSMLNSYKYTYREISIRLYRTEGAIKRRMIDLKVKQRPIIESKHHPWTEEENKILNDMLSKGYKAEVIAEYINKSALAINAKIERILKGA